MLLHPGVMALLLGSALVGLMLLSCGRHAAAILRRWDPKSGSEGQLSLERKTYLVSTGVTYAFGFQILSLFLFLFTAEHLHPLFPGAMCAAGTLAVNGYGYPTLLLKILNFLLAGLWLVLNAADNRGYDYPLVRTKYLFLLAIVPFVLAEGVAQALYFGSMNPNVITSCCGALFGAGGGGVPSLLAGIPPLPAMAAFYLVLLSFAAVAAVYLRRGVGGYLFSAASGAAFLAGAVALVTFVSLYIYALPSHRCPFCVLQDEYGHVGYLLYLGLLGGGVTGLGVGLLMPFRGVESLREAVPSIQRKLALASAALFLLFAAVSTLGILLSDFRLLDL